MPQRACTGSADEPQSGAISPNRFPIEGLAQRSRATFLSRGSSLVIALAVLALAPAVAGAATQSRDDPSDAPGPPSGKADLRTVAWDVGEAAATLKVSLDADGSPADIGVHVLLDPDDNGIADHEILATRNVDGVRVDVKLRDLDRTLSNADCQDLNGKDSGAGGTVTPTVDDGLETFTFSFDPTVVPGGLASFRWAVFGQAPPDGALGGPWDLLPDAANPDPNAPNPDDRRCDSGKSGLAVRMSAGVKFPDPAAEPPATPGPAPHPVVVLAVQGGQPQAGRPATLDANGTIAAAGTHIVAYQWDMNGDGHFDTNTGTNPIAHLITGSHPQHVVVQAIDSNFNAGTAAVTLTPGAPPANCQAEESIGVLQIRAACIRHEGDMIVADPQYDGNRFWPVYAVSLNGAALVTRDPHATVTFDTRHHQIIANGRFQVRLLNGPQGDVMVYESGDGGFTWPFPAGAGRDGGVASMITLRAAHDCDEIDPTSCATVPGGFPITGGVDLGIDTDTREVVFGVNAEITTPITVTGRIRLRADIILGSIRLDQIGFGVRNATIGVFTLDNLQFLYEPPGMGIPAHEGDLWDTAMAIRLAVQPPFGVAGRMRFVNGNFVFASADVRFAPGIPIYAGVLLNRIAGSFGLDPVSFGGGLGASFATVLQINADFLWAVLRDGTLALRGSGNASVYGAQLASAYMEYWTDGYFTFGGRIGFQYPDERHPTFSAFGGIDFWLEAQSGGQPNRFQGDGQLTMTVYGITSSTHGFFNNDWMAGCIGHALTGTYNVHTRVNNMFIGCDLDDYTLTPTRERRGLTPADLATASQAPSAEAFTVGAGERALVLEVMGDGGAPKLTLTDPKGRVYTPANTPQKLVADGAFRSAYLPEGNATLLRVERPLAGEWVLTPQPGSPAIAKVTSATALPPLKVAARVTGRGRKRILTWSTRGLGGRTIRFAERGKNTGNTIVVTKKASGRVGFAPQGGSAGVRTIEAQVSADGIPVSNPVVARYR
ncbi:MAG: hypothetical protein M3O90_11660, partial [Actinomycetota bacterium]|nr:hypothetical protein [Actinomycetota bacterium]